MGSLKNQRVILIAHEPQQKGAAARPKKKIPFHREKLDKQVKVCFAFRSLAF